MGKSALPLLLVAAMLPAAAAAAPRVATVDYQRIFKEAPQIKASEDAVKAQYEPLKKALDKQRKKTRALFKEYRNMDSGTNPLELASIAENFKQARKKLEKMSKQYNSGLDMREAQLQQNFKDTLEQEVSLYAQLHGYTVVMKRGVEYAGPSVDITGAILAALKRDYRQAKSSSSKKGKPR